MLSRDTLQMWMPSRLWMPALYAGLMWLLKTCSLSLGSLSRPCPLERHNGWEDEGATVACFFRATSWCTPAAGVPTPSPSTLRRRSRSGPMPGVTTGPVVVISLEPPTLEVPPRVFTVPNPAAMHHVKVGDQVTVVWEEVAGAAYVIGLTLQRR